MVVLNETHVRIN